MNRIQLIVSITTVCFLPFYCTQIVNFQNPIVTNEKVSLHDQKNFPLILSQKNATLLQRRINPVHVGMLVE